MGNRSDLLWGVITSLLLFFVNLQSLEAQPRRNIGDSLYLDGKLYAPADYQAAKKEKEKYSFETSFMPGVGYGIYQPKSKDSLGTYSGLVLEYLLYGKVEQSDESGPSHVRLYSKLNISKSNIANQGSIFMYTLGLDMSIEKNPKRTWMIPYFGLEAGGLTQKGNASTFQFTPTIGLHVLSRKNLFINVNAGYVYPIKNFETLQGWMGQVGVNFSLW